MSGIKTADGKKFTPEHTDDQIIQYASTIGFPLVVKPIDGSFGRGVITNITSIGDLRKALVKVRKEQNYAEVIVEKHITGQDYRIYVCGNQVVGAIKRVPANVTGDGIHTIRNLIERKNEERKLNPRLISCLIKPDQEMIEYILRNGYSSESIPNVGEKVYLNDKSNISLGGDSEDALDNLTENIKRDCVIATKAIPGLLHGAIDIIVENDKVTVIEINPTAQIGSLIFPMKGKARISQQQ